MNAQPPDRAARPTMADRRLRIELLRMRAGYERMAVRRGAWTSGVKPDIVCAGHSLAARRWVQLHPSPDSE